MYARKSTDVEDKQVLSIDAPNYGIALLAKNEKLEIVEEFVEKRTTAKIPGRPIFGEMMRRIEKGEATGILSLAPRSFGAQFCGRRTDSVFLDIGNLASLKFPSHWFEIRHRANSRCLYFIQSKYYVDSLSENTKRGLRQKVRMGIFPSQAPIGYINDSRTKNDCGGKEKISYCPLGF